jgi:hypothetical protein
MSSIAIKYADAVAKTAKAAKNVKRLTATTVSPGVNAISLDSDVASVLLLLVVAVVVSALFVELLVLLSSRNDVRIPFLWHDGNKLECNGNNFNRTYSFEIILRDVEYSRQVEASLLLEYRSMLAVNNSFSYYTFTA